MSITKIVAHWRCDGCNKEDHEVMDRAAVIKGEALDDLARGYILGVIANSFQGEHLLCRDCTKFIDDEFHEKIPNYDQVCAALNKRAGV